MGLRSNVFSDLSKLGGVEHPCIQFMECGCSVRVGGSLLLRHTTHTTPCSNAQMSKRPSHCDSSVCKPPGDESSSLNPSMKCHRRLRLPHVVLTGLIHPLQPMTSLTLLTPQSSVLTEPCLLFPGCLWSMQVTEKGTRAARPGQGAWPRSLPRGRWACSSQHVPDTGDSFTRFLSPRLVTELPAIFWFGVLATSLCEGKRTL